MNKRSNLVTAAQSTGLGFLLFAGYAAAQTPGAGPIQNMDLNPRSTDLSMKLLHSILGDWSGSSVTNVVGQVFLYFNSGVLVFASILFMYLAVMSVLRTAEDGELMGQGWSSIWIPLRVTSGLALIFPTASGFSVVQIAVLWVASQGIGFANILFQNFATGIINGQGNIVAARIADQSATQNLMANILRAESCIAELNRTHGEGMASPPFQRRTFQALTNSRGGGGGGTITWGNVSPQVAGYTISHCGLLEIPTDAFSSADPTVAGSGGQTDFGGFQTALSNSMTAVTSLWSGVKRSQTSVRNAQLVALDRAAQVLAVPAQRLARTGALSDGTVSTTSAPTSADILTAVNSATSTYRQAIATDTQNALLTQNAALTTSFLESANTSGWIGAGSWYFQMARLNSELNKVTTYVPEMSNIESAEIVGGADTVDRRTPVAASLDALISEAALTNNNPVVPRLGPLGAGTTQGGMAGVMNDASNVVTGAATSWVAEAFSVDPNNPKNAVVQLKSVGDYLISTAEVVFVGGSVLKAKFSKASDMVSGVVKRFSGSKLTEPISLLLMAATTAILISGMMLAFWIPMVPFIIWIGSVLGWLISVIELVIASPVWAAAHLHPEGSGMAGKWGSNGYMILAEVFSRPAFMVLGLLFAMVVVDPFLRFSSALFFNTMDTVNADSVSGLLTMIVFILMYVAFCMSLVNRIFSLITVIPKSALRIIGAVQPGTHDQGEQTAQEIKGGTHTGVSRAQQVGAGTVTAMRQNEKDRASRLAQAEQQRKTVSDQSSEQQNATVE